MRRTNIFIGCFVALQLALPLSYYTCRDDKNDERFAWRMFSPIRHLKCAAVFTIDGERAALGKTFHEAWPRLAGRGRKVVIRQMASRLCADNDGKDVRVQLACRSVSGVRTLTGGQWNFCKTGTW